MALHPLAQKSRLKDNVRPKTRKGGQRSPTPIHPACNRKDTAESQTRQRRENPTDGKENNRVMVYEL